MEIMKAKVIGIDSKKITFDNGAILFSEHDQDCCESHLLTLDDLTIDDFDGLEFDLSNDDFFKRIPDFGIELMPIKGHSVKIPGHGYNNGYYGTNLKLVVEYDKIVKVYDITECQDIKD